MNPLFELIPRVPDHWHRMPRVMVIEGVALSASKIKDQYELMTEKESGKRTAYQRLYARRHANEYNAWRRERYAATKLGARQEEMRAAAVRTMVAMGDQQINPLRDDFQEVEGMHNESGVW